MRRWIALLVLLPLLATVAYPIGALLWSAVVVGPGAASSFTLTHFAEAVSNQTYLQVLGTTLLLCAGTAVLSVLLALPTALFAWSRPPHLRMATLVVLVLPMFMSYIVKVYTMRSLLGLNGFFNSLLVDIGLVDQPTPLLLFNKGAILVTFVVLYIPFAALPIYLSLEKIAPSLTIAARDLGASSARALLDIVLPLALPGIVAAALFAFILALGDFVTPQMVGGPSGMTFGRIVWSQFGLAFNYPLGAALGIVLLVVTLAALLAASLFGRRLVSAGATR